MLIKATPRQKSNHQLIASTLYARALASYQSALLLLGRGSVADARTVVRSLAETAIVLNGVVSDETVCDLLMARHEINQRKLVNAWLADPLARDAMTDEHYAMLTATQKRVAGSAAKDPINIEALAKSVNLLWLYNIVYRTSNDAVIKRSSIYTNGIPRSSKNSLINCRGPVARRSTSM